MIFDPDDLTRIIGVLDWEMATVGDPLMDLGTTLSYWVQPGDPAPLVSMRFGPTRMPGMMTRAEVAARYAERSGRPSPTSSSTTRSACSRPRSSLQQIYYR